jgi:hypothetical protein
MNASSLVISQRKIAALVLFFELTSSATYGWAKMMIVWFVLGR